ncbi:ATP-binding protein [Candidatus Nomurabacteria bacterium]|uniref:ATP-binding protein n=1 Tax=candidate division WWE3 bacterium TaxID=2053526 RepID=A0A955E0Y1_UNCKA|nr:ATP-binding protein [candidate division WWE3 bacterium]MCB9823694.1 ATP-binding protein [Candidatus Nomurabacteria bacterium]MCB9827228.1 ATP-binding protein [Candidatus Nomurabacteria bacterium]MCB9827489.1 ATP-binding protein [Candidatus Nomurabacteria bacterium]HXK52518.1 DUF87 domain-containing protein [bacterium]
MFELLYVLVPILTVVGIVYVLFFNRRVSKGYIVADSVFPDFKLLEIQVPKNEDASKDSAISSLSAEHLFAALHGILKEESNIQEHVSLEIKGDKEGIKFYVGAPASILKYIESQIYAQYPQAHISVYNGHNYLGDRTGIFEVGSMSLEKDFIFPIRVFRDFEIDPLANIASTLSEIKEDDQIIIQTLFKPVPDGWQEKGYKYLAAVTGGNSVESDPFLKDISRSLFTEILSILKNIPVIMIRGYADEPQGQFKVREGGGVRLSAFQELEIKAVEHKLTHMGFAVQMRVYIASATSGRIDDLKRSVGSAYKQFSMTGLNSMNLTLESNRRSALDDFRVRQFDAYKSFILNSEELATIFHLPSASSDLPSISWVYSRKSEPPSVLPTEDCTYIGDTVYRGKKVRFGLSNGDDRLRHMYLIGKSGTGKSTLMEAMVLQDIIRGEGVCLLDPHGETIDKVLDRIPDHRIEDVVVVDPSDTEMPVGINLLELSHPDQKNLMASGLVSAIRHHFDYSWGPRLEYLLNYSLLTLLEVPGTSMLGVTRLLEDVNYQKYILHNVKDPVIQAFWDKEYKEMRGNAKLVTEAIAPIQNKVNRFLSSSTIRNILVQRRSTIDIWDIMNSGKILLINLSKGKIGEDNANLLGALLVSRIQFYALQRANITYDKRKPFYLYVDEFQNFATGSFESILSESRKYKLGLYLTHQYTAQLPEDLQKAVFGNVGTIAAFSLGAPDARILQSEFAPYFDSEDIISLERFNIYIKLMIDGMTSLPFSAKILLPWEEEGLIPKTGNREKILELSRRKYGVPRDRVESAVNKWIERPFDKGMAIAEQIKRGGTNGQ